MDYTTLSRYPLHDESPPSQADRLRDAARPGWETWVLLAIVAALGFGLAALATIYALARGVSGLTG